MMVRLSMKSAYAPVLLDSRQGNILDNGLDIIAVGWVCTSNGGQVSDVLLEVELEMDASCGSYPSLYITLQKNCVTQPNQDSYQGGRGGGGY